MSRHHAHHAHHGRDVPDTGSQKAILGIGLVALAGWLGWEFVIKPGRAQAAPSPTPNPQPGPGPGNLPGPTPPGGRVGDAAVQGDTILVSSSALGPSLGGASTPTNLPKDVEMVVTGAAPGSAVVLAQTTGAGGVPEGVQLPVPREAITMVSHTGPTPDPNAPHPGNLPGPIPGLPNVVPPVIPAIPGVPQDLGNPMALQTGHHYRARLELGSIEAMMANTDAVRKTFEGQGFTDVRVFHSGVDPLPADWPPITTVAASNGVWYGMGTWNGPTGPVPRPPQIAMAWEQ
jgi:hypothetical protein